MEEITAEARQLIERIREILEPHEDILTVYLFGSAVKNRLRVDSDIDIAVAGKSIFTFDQKLEIANVLTKNLHREIDCIDLKAENGLLMYEILTKGKRVFAKDKKLTFEEFDINQFK